MRNHSEYQIATSSLKRALKRQKITYRELALALELSESGVKKILTARDGSFQRIAEISRHLGLSLYELLEGERETPREFSFTESQQELLLKNKQAFELYWRLVYERQSLADAEKAGALQPKETFALLRKLDQVKLLALLPGGRVRVPPVQQIRWVGDNPLVRKLYEEWSQSLLRRVARPTLPTNAYFLIRYFKVSPKTQTELISALKNLETEFVRRATQEMRTEAPELVHLRWLSAIDDKSLLE